MTHHVDLGRKSLSSALDCLDQTQHAIAHVVLLVALRLFQWFVLLQFSVSHAHLASVATRAVGLVMLR